MRNGLKHTLKKSSTQKKFLPYFYFLSKLPKAFPTRGWKALRQKRRQHYFKGRIAQIFKNRNADVQELSSDPEKLTTLLRTGAEEQRGYYARNISVMPSVAVWRPNVRSAMIGCMKTTS
jgi:mevalonate pyrophosphate decarboxylase